MPQPPPSTSDKLGQIYRLLLEHYGPQHWWPADEPLEVIVGAILTQAAAWRNVEKAIDNLKRAQALYLPTLRQLPIEELAQLLYPCGYYNAKAKKLQAFANYMGECHNDNLKQLFALDVDQLRRELLPIHGIGYETADSIILYAARKPVFVIDAYTCRIMRRLSLAPASDSYAAFQALFIDNLPLDEGLFNEYHALLVRHGKDVCKKTPLCPQCCLKALCPGLGG